MLKLWLPDSTQAALVEQQEQAAPAADVANASSHENTMPAQEVSLCRQKGIALLSIVNEK